MSQIRVTQTINNDLLTLLNKQNGRFIIKKDNDKYAQLYYDYDDDRVEIVSDTNLWITIVESPITKDTKFSYDKIYDITKAYDIVTNPTPKKIHQGSIVMGVSQDPNFYSVGYNAKYISNVLMNLFVVKKLEIDGAILMPVYVYSNKHTWYSIV